MTTSALKKYEKHLKILAETMKLRLIITENVDSWKFYVMDSLLIEINPSLGKEHHLFEINFFPIVSFDVSDRILIEQVVGNANRKIGHHNDQLFLSDSSIVINRIIKLNGNDPYGITKLLSHLYSLTTKSLFTADSILKQVEKQKTFSLN